MVKRLVCATLFMIAAAVLTSGCSGEEAIPIDPANPPTTELSDGPTDVTHQLEPTEEMKAAARQQCLADPELDQGYVRAVDPATDTVVAEYAVDCAGVSGEESGEVSAESSGG